MRIDRVSAKSKQTKRRLIVLAITFGCVVTYEASLLFGDETKVSRPTVSEIPKVPAARSIGIRIAAPSGPRIISNTNSSSSLNALPAAPLLPPSTAQTPSTAPTWNTLPQLPTEPSDQDNSEREERGLPLLPPSLPNPSPSDSLNAPLPMPNARSNGRVSVKLSGSSTEFEATDGIVTGSTLLPLIPSGSTHLPSMVVTSGAYTVPAVATVHTESETTSTAKPKGQAVRVNIGGSDENIVETQTTVVHRSPEQIKPTRNGVAVVHSVGLVDPDDVEQPSIKTVPPKSVLIENVTPTSVALPPRMTPPVAVVPAPIGLPSETKNLVPKPSNGLVIEPNSRDVSTKKRTGVRASLTSSNSVVEIVESEKSFNQSKPSSVAVTLEPFPVDAAIHNNPSETINVECSNAIEIPLAGKVLKVQMEAEDVCNAMAHDRSISVIGSKLGKARIAVWTETDRLKPRILNVNVVKPWVNQSSKVVDCDQIKSAISQQFPAAKLSVTLDSDGALTIKGTVSEDASARKIIELVRKLYLVPVYDKIDVQR